MKPEIKQTIYAVAYARVSTDDHDQNPESQLQCIRKWAKERNIRILEEFKDESTGTNTNRPGYHQMMGYIGDNPKVTMCIVLDADRLSRNIDDTSRIVKKLNDSGVRLTYVVDENLDVSSMEGKVINTIKSYGAQAYTEHHRDKILAGMERARQEGKHIGRPSKRTADEINVDMLLIFAQNGKSLHDLEKIYKCSRNTIARRLKDEGKMELFKQYFAKATNNRYNTNPIKTDN